MIVAVSIIVGFKSTISEQVFGFSSHLEIVNFDSNNSFESMPIFADSSLEKKLNAEENVVHIQKYATKPAIIKVNNTARGIIVKGIDDSYNWTFIKNHLVDGELLTFPFDTTTDDVIVSKTLANLLQLSVGDKFSTSFVPNDANDNSQPRLVR